VASFSTGASASSSSGVDNGLGQKEHEADRWVAATAVWLQIPLVAHDAIFANVKDLELLTRLAQ
jgi:hypothetical protein